MTELKARGGGGGGSDCVGTWHCMYSGTSLIRTLMGQKKVSFLVRCPHFSG